jgi:hypothetical protein
MAWYALIGITANQARLSAKHAVITALQESRQAAERKGERQHLLLPAQRAGPAK